MSRHLDRDCAIYKKLKSKTSADHNNVSDGCDISTLFDSYNSSRDNKLSEDGVKDAVLDYFISGNIAFNQADNPEFQKLIGMIKINGHSVTVNRRNICSRLDFQAEIARRDLKNNLALNDSKVSLALDCWTSRINHAYMGTFTVAYK